MSKVDEARSAVNALERDFSSIEEFLDAYSKIVDAGKTLQENEQPDLQKVVGNFRQKIRDGATFQKLKDSAAKFEADLAATIIGTGMANIAARNAELQQMLAALNQHNAAALADANKLKQVTENIDKATAAVKTAKSLFSTLTNGDTSKMQKLQAVINALEDLQEDFKLFGSKPISQLKNH